MNKQEPVIHAMTAIRRNIADLEAVTGPRSGQYLLEKFPLIRDRDKRPAGATEEIRVPLRRSSGRATDDPGPICIKNGDPVQKVTPYWFGSA